MSRLPYSITEDAIRSLFNKFGTIKSVKVKKPPILNPQLAANTTTMSAIAYVDFESEADAAKAIE